MEPVIVKVLDISTAHMSEQDSEKLNRCNKGSVINYGYLEGNFVYLGDPSDVDDTERVWTEAGYSMAFIMACRKARESGCKYAQFDRDGTVYDDLERFDW